MQFNLAKTNFAFVVAFLPLSFPAGCLSAVGSDRNNDTVSSSAMHLLSGLIHCIKRQAKATIKCHFRTIQSVHLDLD